MNIELTEVQLEALNRGECILLKPRQAVKQWEPRREGGCESVHTTYSETGSACDKAFELMRSMSRLLSYVEEFGGGWEANWGRVFQEKCSVTFTPERDPELEDGEWSVFSHAFNRHAGVVYMSKECAKVLARKLNSGEVVL